MANATSRQELDLLQGLVADSLHVQADAELNAGTDAELTAKASSTKGESSATASLDQSDGVLATELTIDGDATTTGSSKVKLTADSTGVTGDGSASSTVNTSTGLTTDQLDIGGQSSLTGSSNATVIATTATTGGDGRSTAQINDATGIRANNTKADGDVAIRASASNTLTSTATVTNSIGDAGFPDGASATTELGDSTGASLGPLDLGDGATVAASVTTTSTATANATTGSAAALVQLAADEGKSVTGLDLTANPDTSSNSIAGEGSLQAEVRLNSNATAATTTGAASSTVNAGLVQGTYLGSAETSIGGDGTVSGAITMAATSEATNVSGGDVTATASLEGAKGLSQDDSTTKASLLVSGDGTLTGTVSNTVRVAATSSAGDATAEAGSASGGDIYGVDLQSATVNGSGTLTGQVATNTSATATSTEGEATALVDPANRTAVQAYDIEFGNDGAITSTNSSVAAATATSTAGLAIAQVGSDAADLINSAIDGSYLNVGGDTTLSAITNGDADATASSVSDSATAQVFTSNVGVAHSAFIGDADATFTGTAINTSSVKASSVGDNLSDEVLAAADLSSIGFDTDDLAGGFGLKIAGNATVNGTAGIQSDVAANITLGDAIASGDFFGFGVQLDNVDVGGTATFKGIGLIDTSSVVADVGSNGFAAATSTISLTGLQVADKIHAGDNASFENQVSGKLSTIANNIGGDADANATYGITGMDLGTLDLAADATLKSVLVDDFKTTASSVKGNVNSGSDASLLGIGLNGPDSAVAGDLRVSSVISHTSFITAQTVRGTADASDHLNAIGVSVGDLNVDGNVTLSSNVVVRATSSSDS